LGCGAVSFVSHGPTVRDSFFARKRLKRFLEAAWRAGHFKCLILNHFYAKLVIWDNSVDAQSSRGVVDSDRFLLLGVAHGERLKQNIASPPSSPLQGLSTVSFLLVCVLYFSCSFTDVENGTETSRNHVDIAGCTQDFQV